MEQIIIQINGIDYCATVLEKFINRDFIRQGPFTISGNNSMKCVKVQFKNVPDMNNLKEDSIKIKYSDGEIVTSNRGEVDDNNNCIITFYYN